LEEELHEKAHIDYDRVAIVPNPSVAALYEDALVYETGSAITSTGALTAYSGAKTGRSPLDKRIVKETSSETDIWWGPVNKPMTPEVRANWLSDDFFFLTYYSSIVKFLLPCHSLFFFFLPETYYIVTYNLRYKQIIFQTSLSLIVCMQGARICRRCSPNRLFPDFPALFCRTRTAHRITS
jgi:Phosphoenolpyruvate carboxykinase